MAEDKPFIPMDDPRRKYKIPGTNYAMCQPGLTGNWAGYKNTPEEQKVMDDFHRANKEEIKNMTAQELRAYIEATAKSINDKDEADRLLTDDICRQQAELAAQREVERRVYYRQKALKEAKKKEKEERARVRALARGEIVDGGEGAAGSRGDSQVSGGGTSGVIENNAMNGRNTGAGNGNAIAQDHGTNGGQTSTTVGTEIDPGQARGGELAASTARGSVSSQNMATALDEAS